MGLIEKMVLDRSALSEDAAHRISLSQPGLTALEDIGEALQAAAVGTEQGNVHFIRGWKLQQQMAAAGAKLLRSFGNINSGIDLDDAIWNLDGDVTGRCRGISGC